MVFRFVDGAISWKLKKQTIMTLTSIEVGHVPVALVLKECYCLNVFKELNVIKFAAYKNLL